MKTLKDLITLANKPYNVFHSVFGDALKLMEKYVNTKGLLLDKDNMFKDSNLNRQPPKKGNTNKYNIHLYDKNHLLQRRMLHALIYFDGLYYLIDMRIN